MSFIPTGPRHALGIILESILGSLPDSCDSLTNTPDEYVSGVAELSPVELNLLIDPPDQSVPQLGGGMIGLGIEGVNIAVTLAAILIHLWHCRTTLLAANEERGVLKRLPAVWSRLLVKHGFSDEEAARICREFAADLASVLDTGVEDLASHDHGARITATGNATDQSKGRP